MQKTTATLKLDVNPEGWSLFNQRQADPRFIEFSQKIYQRDQYLCHFCTKQTQYYQAIVNLDRNYVNNKSSNLVTACGFCAQCFFLNSVGVGGYGGGVLIYLPEIPQAYLNAFCHTAFAAIDANTEYKETAQNAYRHLKLRTQVIESEWGEHMNEPALFAQLLIELDDRSMLASNVFSSVRLLPSRTAFLKERELEKQGDDSFPGLINNG